MAKGPYEKFIEASNKNAKGYKSKPDEAIIPSYPTSVRMNLTLAKSIEGMEEELRRFEQRFVNEQNSVVWLNDFSELFSEIKRIQKPYRTKEIAVLDDLSCNLFRELGLDCYFEDKKAIESVTAPIQLMKGDLLISETGHVLFSNRTLDYVEKLNNGKLNLIIVPLNRIAGNASIVKNYSQLAGLKGNLTPTLPFTFFKGSESCKTVLFIVDNQRTDLLKHKIQRQALTCSECGKCEEVCPIDKVVGKEAYDNVFTGPIGRVVLPYMETIEDYRHVVYACTLCGKCEEVCPQRLPLIEMILATRKEIYNHNLMDLERNEEYAKYAKYASDRKRLNRPAWIKQKNLSKQLSPEFKESIAVPKFCEKSFAEINEGK